MNHKFNARLADENESLGDIQFWSDNKEEIPSFKTDLLTFVAYIRYDKIPVYLISSRPFSIFTNNTNTSNYFERKLVQKSLINQIGLGLLAKKGATEGEYSVFYYDDSQVKSFTINFNFLETVQEFIANKKYTLNSFITNDRQAPNEAILKSFDKALEKRLEPNPFILNEKKKHSNSSVLSTPEQINTAVTKIISSGLRIRGLSVSSATSVNEKLKIKEIYQMTQRATLFSLRKYNDTNVKKPGSKRHPITLSELQEIVENLLHLFIDLE
ncbi:SLD7 [Candida oxycetoniae]|uniref:Mitochondrial morphogenesis protein SLD7 n=1 Tax=Candida oxycetoniae TaxID=497107 RepID=A0AAI9SYV4_9ASCO|nr:SLD7 [Candida oxycetoniae]KAI3405743.2 SLD7 [Candida oxycetoniae]